VKYSNGLIAITKGCRSLWAVCWVSDLFDQPWSWLVKSQKVL